jgi:uncharacterized protein YdaU (DUF1376 family)
MTPEEEGGYFHLLCWSWNSPDCSIPDDDIKLASLSRLGEKWKQSSEKIRERFEAKEGKLHPKTLTDLFYDAADVSDSKKKGADKRWGKEKYFESEIQAYETLKKDQEWIGKMKILNPGIDILLTIEKAHRFWGSEAGWENRKRKKSKTYNWTLTYENSLSNSMNRVWLPKGQQEITEHPYERLA